MKSILAVAAGFLVALGTFAGGAFVTFLVLAPEPERELAASEDLTALWTSVPRPVDVAAQDLERIAPSQASILQPVGEATGEPDLGIDATTTSALTDDGQDGGTNAAVANDAEEALLVAHVEWCANRYRSYDIDSNTYRPFSGGSRDCISPYLEELEALEAGGDDSSQPGEYIDASAGYADAANAGSFEDARSAAYGSQLSMSHVQACLDRYRSYRPEDNTYQPYGGGPRRVCE